MVSLTTELFHRNDNDNDEYYTHKTSIKMYTFLLHWFLSQTKKSGNATSTATKKVIPIPNFSHSQPSRGKKKKDADTSNTWDSDSSRESFLTSLIHILELDLPRLWKMTYPEDEFLSLFATTSYSMLENSANTKNKGKNTKFPRNFSLN